MPTLTATKRLLGSLTGERPKDGCARQCSLWAYATRSALRLDRVTITWTGDPKPLLLIHAAAGAESDDS